MDARATGALIAARRKSLDLSQAELAERLHVTDKAVSRWETGRGMPGLESLEPLSEVLGLSVSELLSGKELTQAELPKTAGGQIMESMKREHLWKLLAWLAMAAVTLLAAWSAAVFYIQAQQERAAQEQAEQERWERYTHYINSVNPNEEADIAEATADYFEGQGMHIRFNPKSLKVRETVFLTDYMAVLLSDRKGEWCMSFWCKDAVYPERYCILGGRSRISPGFKGLAQWNFGTQEQPVIVISGVDLPEEACFYEWEGDGRLFRGWVNTGLKAALDISIPALPMGQKQVSSPRIELCDSNGAYLPRNLK